MDHLKSGVSGDNCLSSSKSAAEESSVSKSEMERKDDGNGDGNVPEAELVQEEGGFNFNNADAGGQGSNEHLSANEAFLLRVIDGLKESLSEAKDEICRKDHLITQLTSRLDHFLKEFPKFEGQLKELKSLLEEERTLKALIGILKMSAEDVSKTCLGKQEEVVGLVGRVDRMKMKQRSQGDHHHHGEIETEEEENLGGGIDAVSILPEEIWELIFEKLTDQKDLWNCSNTCALFKKVLQDWKQPTWEFMQVLPLLFQYLPRNMVLKCRSVSKGWNMVVDDYFQNHPSLRPYSKDKFDYRMLPFVPPMQDKEFQPHSSFDFRAGEFNKKNVAFPNTPGRNPFIGRAVALPVGMDRARPDSDDYDDSDDEEWFRETEERYSKFWESINDFLETFGKDICYLTFDSRFSRHWGFLADDESIAELMTIKVLSHAPNLRMLRILPSENVEDYAEIEDIDLGLLPAAPSLETIEAWSNNVNGEHAPLVALLNRHHDTLRALYLSGSLWKTVSDLDWPHLLELHLVLDFRCINFNLKVWDALLEAVENKRMPNLRKLGVNLKGKPSGFPQLLEVIHRCFGTSSLTTLRIYGGVHASASPLEPATTWKSCISPTLKTLEVEHVENGFYSFLLHFPYVENVHLFCIFCIKNTPPLPPFSSQIMLGQQLNPVQTTIASLEMTLDIHNYVQQRKMYHSNIWELLPRLKLFTFRWDVYTRAGYEQFKEQQRKKKPDS